MQRDEEKMRKGQKRRMAVKETEEKMRKRKKTMNDEGKLPINSRFFKVLVPGFQKALKLPRIICKMLNGEIPETAILVSCRGSWRVGVGKCSMGLTFNGEGWDSFIRNHDLSVGEFIVFEHTGHMIFNTLVFDITACKKRFPMTVENVKDKGSVGDIDKLVKCIKSEPDEATASYQHKNACLQITLQRYSVVNPYPFLYIPGAFTRSNDLSEKTSVTLLNPSGEAWQVELKIHNWSGRRHKRMLFTKGWEKFVEANKLKVGDICVFELKHSLETSNNAVMDVHICSK